MSKTFCYILSLAFCIGAHADGEGLTFMLTGASFAHPANGWFELTCEKFGIEAINKAKPGTSITHTARAMHAGTFYTQDELRRTDALVIMHVLDGNVANTRHLKDDFNDYTRENMSYWHIAYDYVIKRYMDDCRNLKDDPLSEYYRSENGKPAVIMLSTHWHDARVTYNASIRKVADQWNLPLIKFDENIGFTKDVPDPDGKQPSLRYSDDTQTSWSGDVVYGWHPNKGENQYIQKKMAEIFESEVVKIFEVER